VGRQLALLGGAQPEAPPVPAWQKPWDDFSPCGTYRYELGQRWAQDGPLINFLMLNPSIASKDRPDPTWTRCCERGQLLAQHAAQSGSELAQYLRRGGIPGGVVATNLHALVSTDPEALKYAEDPIGPDNDARIEKVASEAAIVICAWGVHGKLKGRGEEVRSRLQALGIPLHVLEFTAGAWAQPKHPLYIAYDVMPRPW